jgi:hypothetical protein
VRVVLVTLVLAIASDGRLHETANGSAVTELEFCQLPVADVLREGRASFSVAYKFRVKDGKATDVREVTNPAGIPRSAVAACIGKWRFGNASFGESEVAAEFRWTHGVGWERLHVRGAGIDMRVSISGDRCAYR